MTAPGVGEHGDAADAEAERRRGEKTRAQWKRRYERLERSRSGGLLVGTGKRFFDIDGLTQGGLLAIELFTTVIPLMIIGFSYLSGFAENESVGNVFINTLGLGDSSAATVRAAFGTSAGLRSTWTIFGVAGFLVWGIPMSITVASMYRRGLAARAVPHWAPGCGAVRCGSSPTWGCWLFRRRSQPNIIRHCTASSSPCPTSWCCGRSGR